eukprot:448504-Pyramimonas_sp.AAC.2
MTEKPTGELNYRVTMWLYQVLTVNSSVSVSSPNSRPCNRAGANRGPVKSIYPGREPIAGWSRACTQGESQSRAGREHMPGARTNRGLVESIYPGREPIAGRSRAYTQGGSQSQAGR